MAITGQISLARAGETVQVFQNVSDLNDIFDSNATPSLQDFDHVTLYPGDFTDIGNIEIPEDPEVYLTILPGASVGYNFALQEIDRARRLQDRYEDFSGAVENIADLNIAHLYETSVEKQLSRVRRYIDSTDETPEPYVEYNNLDDAAEDASSGETIVVFPGNYQPENNLLIDGVDWKFLSGAKVTFDPDSFEQYPYALFDDSKTPNGASKESNGVNSSIFGDGKFVIGRKSFKNLIEEGTANTDWDGWHKYSLLALSKNQSDVKFEADTVRLQNKADAAIKYAKSSNLDVNVETLEFGPQNRVSIEVKSNTFSDLTDVPLPAFMVVNGHIGGEPETQKVDINVEEVVIEESDEGLRLSFPYLLSGVNPNQNNGFSGEIYLSFEKQGGLDAKTAVSFPESASHGPQKVLIENSNLNGPVELAGSSFQKTHLIIKETEIQDENDAPILLSGNGNNIGVSLSEAWLLSENAQYSIKNETGSTDFTIKAYNNSFADLPIEDFKEVLHDELNNIAWSEDVGSIR